MDQKQRRLNFIFKPKFNHLKGLKQTRNMIIFVVKEELKVEKLEEEGWLGEHGKMRQEMIH